MLTHKAIVESETTFAIEKVPTPAWAQICGIASEECYLYARTLGAERADDVQRISQRQQTREKAKEANREAMAFAEWAVLGACDEHGKPFFTEADSPSLLERPFMPLVNLANVTMKLNGIITETQAEKEVAAPNGAPKAD